MVQPSKVRTLSPSTGSSRGRDRAGFSPEKLKHGPGVLQMKVALWSGKSFCKLGQFVTRNDKVRYSAIKADLQFCRHHDRMFVDVFQFRVMNRNLRFELLLTN